jgi:hypothetical protein
MVSAAKVVADNIGIGTESPNYELEVETDALNSVISVNSTAAGSYPSINFDNDSATNWRIYAPHGGLNDSFNIYEANTGTRPFLILPNGNVGIGTDDPFKRLHVKESSSTVTAITADGGIQCSGDIVAFTNSDVRLKDNISTITFPLEKIDQLNGVEFTWNSLAENKTGDEYGIIAQDVEKVLPLAVTERDTGYKAVRYEKLIPLLVECIKELSEKVKRLEGDS